MAADLIADLGEHALFVRTEPHSPARLRWTGAMPRVDLDDLLTTGHRARRSAAREAIRRLDDAIADGKPEALVFDTTEGWLSTTLCLHVRRRHPGVRRIGLQHGLLAIHGWKSNIVVRRLRMSASVMAVALTAPFADRCRLRERPLRHLRHDGKRVPPAHRTAASRC